MRLGSVLVITVFALSLGVGARAASAGIEVVTETTSVRPPSKKTGKPAPATEVTGRLLLEGDRGRVEGLVQGPEGRDGARDVAIYRADRHLVWVLNERRRTYVELDEETARAIGSTISSARKEVQAQLDKLPANQRATAEKALGALADQFGLAPEAITQGPPKVPPLRAAASGKSDTVSGFPCREFDIRQGSQSIAEACVASWPAVGLSRSDIRVLQDFGRFAREAAAEVGSGDVAEIVRGDPLAVLDQVDGVPVRVRVRQGGAVTDEVKVVSVKRRDLDPSLFDLPAGYRKEALTAR